MWQGASRYAYLLLAAWITVAGLPALAQPAVEIYWNPSNRADTVVDFGVTTIGNPVPIAITVENPGTDTVAILPTDQLTYYAILDIPGAPQIPDWKLEFSPVILATPFIVPPGGTSQLFVSYLAQDLPNLPEETLAEVLLELKVVRLRQPLGPWTEKRFRLKGIKTAQFVATSSPSLRFDSVYVRPVPAPQQSFRVDNVTNRSFPVIAQRIVPRSSVIDSVEFFADTLVNASFGPRDVLRWELSYKPRNTGFDSAEFQVVYQPNPNTRGDTVVTRLSGIGVEQRLEVVSATDTVDQVTLQVRGDTVDFGTLDAGLYSSVDATVILRNTGNTNIFVEAEQKSGRTQADTASFQIRRPLLHGDAPVRSTIRTNEFDTIVVRFEPVGSETYIARYRVTTDLHRRTSIAGVPEDAQYHTIILMGKAIVPRPEVSDTALNFGSLPLVPQQCESSSTRTIRIRNVGTALLTGQLTLEPPSVPVALDRSELRLPPDSVAVIQLRYEPDAVGVLDAHLVVTTNTSQQPRIHLTGECREPDTVRIAVADTFRLQPGTLLRLPILVSARDISLAQRGLIQLTYDPSVLQYRSFQNASTATAGASVQTSADGEAGRLTLQMVQPAASFIASDTLIVVEFATFVGRVASTALTLSPTSTTFGTLDCPNALAVRITDGRFTIDSLCGLSSKLVQPRSAMIRAAVFPNPVAEDATVTIVAGRAQMVTVTIVDAFGRMLASPLQHPVHEGLTILPLDLRHVPPGAAYVQVRGSDTLTMIPTSIPTSIPITVPVMVQR